MKNSNEIEIAQRLIRCKSIAPNADNALKIVEKEFMGNIIRYTVDVKEKKLFVDIVQEYNSLTYKKNDEIELSFKVSKLRFIK